MILQVKRSPIITRARAFYHARCLWWTTIFSVYLRNLAQRHRVSARRVYDASNGASGRWTLDSRRLCRRRPLGFADIKSHPFYPCRRRRRVRDARTKSRLLALRASLDRKWRTSGEIRLHAVECVAGEKTRKCLDEERTGVECQLIQTSTVCKFLMLRSNS